MNKKEALIILGIIFVSFNLRAPITAVGSLADMIQTQYGLSSGTTGFITTLPLIAFAVVSPFVARIYYNLGYGKLMAIGLLLIMGGELLRSYTNITGLFVGTALIGVGIAIGNVLIPSIIKMKFPNHLGRIISIYTSSMCIFAAVGAGISVPLAKGLGLGWKNALAVWSILAILTLLIWLPQLKQEKNLKPVTPVEPVEPIASAEPVTSIISGISGETVDPIASAPSAKVPIQKKYTSIWKSPIAWWVTLFMGTQSLLFYSLVAWLPTIVVSKGMSDSFSGNMALSFQLIAIPATLTIPLLCDTFKNQRGLVMLTCALYLSGMLTFLFAQSQPTIFLAILLMSLGMGGSISLSIAFISLKSSNAKRAAELSGMSQSVGYLLAAIGPIFIGLIYDNLQTWTLPIVIFCGIIILLAFLGYFAGNDVITE